MAAQPATETPAKDPDQEEKLAKKKIVSIDGRKYFSQSKSRKSLMKLVRRAIQTSIF